MYKSTPLKLTVGGPFVCSLSGAEQSHVCNGRNYDMFGESKQQICEDSCSFLDAVPKASPDPFARYVLIILIERGNELKASKSSLKHYLGFY